MANSNIDLIGHLDISSGTFSYLDMSPISSIRLLIQTRGYFETKNSRDFFRNHKYLLKLIYIDFLFKSFITGVQAYTRRHFCRVVAIRVVMKERQYSVVDARTVAYSLVTPTVTA